jgi:hypothetical protein
MPSNTLDEPAAAGVFCRPLRKPRCHRNRVAMTCHCENSSTGRVDGDDVSVVRPKRRGRYWHRTPRRGNEAVEEAQHDGRVRGVVAKR